MVRVVSLLAGAGVASANSVNVGLLSAIGNTSYENDVIAKIQADAPFMNITPIHVDSMTPDLGTLESYQTLMVVGNNAFNNATTLGNELKQYIDDGHGLVIAAQTNQPGNCSFTSTTLLCGAFNSSDYWAIDPGTVKSGAATLGTVLVPGSPIFMGVTKGFNGGTGSYRINGLVDSSATAVATWSDGLPFAATRQFASGAVEVALNFYPVSGDVSPNFGFWLSSTDGALIMTNAIEDAGGITGAGAVPEADSFMLAGAGLAALSLLLKRIRRSVN